MTFTLLVLLYFLSVMRITRLINFDTVMDWLHEWVGRHLGPGSWVAEFLECPWCVGMWVALFTAWAPILIGHVSWWNYPLLALSASMVTGLTARFSSEKTALEPR